MEQENWLSREVVLKLLKMYYKYPGYSYKGIGDKVGCNRATVKRYVNRWESGIQIPQLNYHDTLEIKRIELSCQHEECLIGMNTSKPSLNFQNQMGFTV